MVAGMPGAFLSVGVLIAGLGLAVALAKATGATGQAGANPAVAAAATKAAIGAASGKILLMFVVGAIALVLRFLVSWMRAGAARDVARFNGALVEHIHFANAESVGVRQQDALHFQAKSLQRLGEELATSMGQSTRSAIMEGYADIASRLEALAACYADLVDAAQEGAREAVTQGFEKSVDANAGEVLRRMETVAEAMAAMPARLEEGFRSSVDAGTKDVVARMQEVSDAMAALPERVDQVALALENAGADLAGRQAGFVLKLQDEAAQSAVTTARTIADNVQTATQNALTEMQDIAGRITEGLVRLPDRIEMAAKTFDAASGRMAEVQETVAERSQAQALDAVASVTAMISQAVDGLAKDVEETISVSLRQTTDTIRTVAQGHERPAGPHRGRRGDAGTGERKDRLRPVARSRRDARKRPRDGCFDGADDCRRGRREHGDLPVPTRGIPTRCSRSAPRRCPACSPRCRRRATGSPTRMCAS